MMYFIASSSSSSGGREQDERRAGKSTAQHRICWLAPLLVAAVRGQEDGDGSDGELLNSGAGPGLGGR